MKYLRARDYNKTNLLEQSDSNMITKIFKYIQNTMMEFIEYFTSIPSFLRGFFVNVTVFLHDQKIKFQDILQTNIELGKHHLFRGRVNDALLRFRIANTLFDTQNKEINYWIGVCYFFKAKYDMAIPYLEEGQKFDNIRLSEFIQNYDTAKSVPDGVWNIIKSVSIADSDDRYYFSNSAGEAIDLPQEFVRFCLQNIKEIKPDMKIMDYGCGTGLVGSMLDKLVSAEYSISAIEDVSMFVDYANEIRGDRGRVYDNVFLGSLTNIQNVFSSKKYDLIISFDSLTFTKDLQHYFNFFAKGLSEGGFLAILLPITGVTEWSKSNKIFMYSKNDIEEQLKLAEFEILDIKIWRLSANKSFAGFICRK